MDFHTGRPKLFVPQLLLRAHDAAGSLPFNQNYPAAVACTAAMPGMRASVEAIGEAVTTRRHYLLDKPSPGGRDLPVIALDFGFADHSEIYRLSGLP